MTAHYSLIAAAVLLAGPAQDRPAATTTAPATAAAPAAAAEPSVQVLTGLVMRYSARTGNLVLRVGRRQVPVWVDGKTVLRAADQPARREWLVRNVPLRVVLVDPIPATATAPARRGRRRPARAAGPPPRAALVEFQTERITARVVSTPGRDRLRVSPERIPATQPARAARTTASRRRARLPSRMTLQTVKRTTINRQGAARTLADLAEDQMLTVTFIPGGRYPIALAIEVARDAPRRRTSRIGFPRKPKQSRFGRKQRD